MLLKICRDYIKSRPHHPLFHPFSRFYQTHYKVLNLPNNCTTQQVKNAFIKLSKEHHPDVNKSEQSHSKFLKINDAYKVLGKPSSRRSYDLGLAVNNGANKEHWTDDYTPETFTQSAENPHRDPLFWANRDKTKDDFHANRPYYGIKGVQRVSNSTIVVLCILCALAGVCLQFLAITKSFTLRRDDIIRKSIETQLTLNDARAIASTNGNVIQLEALKLKLSDLVKKDADNK